MPRELTYEYFVSELPSPGLTVVKSGTTEFAGRLASEVGDGSLVVFNLDYRDSEPRDPKYLDPEGCLKPVYQTMKNFKVVVIAPEPPFALRYSSLLYLELLDGGVFHVWKNPHEKIPVPGFCMDRFTLR